MDDKERPDYETIQKGVLWVTIALGAGALVAAIVIYCKSPSQNGLMIFGLLLGVGTVVALAWYGGQVALPLGRSAR